MQNAVVAKRVVVEHTSKERVRENGREMSEREIHNERRTPHLGKCTSSEERAGECRLVDHTL